MATGPQVPKKLVIGPHVYSVKLDADQVEAADATYGITRSHLQSITLHPSQAAGQLRETLLHETLHALIADTGASDYAGVDHPLLTKDMEERLISAISPRLLDLLRRNPKLIAFLLCD